MKMAIRAWLPIAFLLVYAVVSFTAQENMAAEKKKGSQVANGAEQWASADFTKRRKRLGRSEKLRIMVDKVACRDNREQRMTEEHVKLYADAKCSSRRTLRLGTGPIWTAPTPRCSSKCICPSLHFII